MSSVFDNEISFAVVLAVGLLAGLYDLWKMRVSNRLTALLLITGLAYQGALCGEWLMSLLGMLIGFGILLPLYLTGGMGAGDVKLAAAVGAWVGPILIVEVLLTSFLLSGVYSTVLLLLRLKSGAESFSQPSTNVEDLLPVHQTKPSPAARRLAIPFAAVMAVAIAGVAYGVRWQPWAKG